MKYHKGLLILVAAVAVLVLAGLGFALRPGVTVQAVEVQSRTIRRFVDERAQTRLSDTYMVTMPLAGRLDGEPIARLREGTRVAQGEPVARIVPEDLELAVRQAQAAVGQLDASLAENADVRVERTGVEQAVKLVEAMSEAVRAAAVRIDASRTNLEYAQAHLARTRELRRTNARTEDEWELAVVQHAEATAAYRQDQLVYAAMLALEGATNLLPGMIGQYIDRRLEPSADVLRRRRDEAQAALDRALRDQQRGEMRSPVDGVVLRRFVEQERFVPAGRELLELGRLEDLQIEADLLSIDAVDVSPGAPVEIYGPAVGEPPARGTVARVEPAGFTKLSALGVEQQRVKAVVDIDPADRTRLLQERRMAVGYRVRVRIITAKKDDALVVPRSALFRDAEGRWCVFAVRRGIARKEAVELGLANDQEAEVVDGLAAGDLVVDVPDSTLSDGTRVSARKD